MSNNHNHPFSRRNFLKIMGLTTSLPLMQTPVQILLESIILGAQRKAEAEILGIFPRRYLHILQEGAPPRWSFDLFLTPYNTTAFTGKTAFGNHYVGSGGVATGLTYETVLKKGVNVPHLWNFPVPAVGGGMRPMDGLLDNLLLLRGIVVGNPDHTASQALQFLPLGSTQSMTALSGDLSTKPFPSVNASVAQFKYSSNVSKSAVTISGGGNMLNTLLSPFIRKDLGSFNTNRLALSSALDASISALDSVASNLHPGSDSITLASQSAKDLLSSGFGNLTTVWDSLVNKYTDLITRGIDPTQLLPGINDLKIAPNGTKDYQINGIIITDPDIRTMITTSTYIGRMAAHFAMAEYVLINNLSDSVAIAPYSFIRFNINGALESGQNDEHTTSAMVSNYYNSFYNLAYSACLLELIDQLKIKGIFSDTVIVTGGEFGRNPLNDGTGSDHGYLGSSSAIYSGAIGGPIVLGNIYQNSPQPNYSGTWGHGAPVAELGEPLNLAHWASTIAYLLRTPSPVTAGGSLLVAAGSDLVPTIEKAKQV